jgi:hypothetical protein
MKTLKYFMHYFFGKHKWTFKAKSFRGNDKVGHTEDCYYFECVQCHKEKRVKVVK